MRKYKMHIIIFSISLVLSTISVIIGIFSGLLHYERQLRFIADLSYEYCYQFSGNDYVSDSFVDLNASYSVKANKTIKCDKLMQVSTEYSAKDVWGKIPVLQSNEAYLSSNLLTLHNLSIGDELYIQIPNSAQPIQCIIAGKFESCYGLYDKFVDSNKGIIIFGLDENYLTNNKTDFITYQSAEFKASSTASQLKGVFSLEKQYAAVKSDFFRIVILIWCVQLIFDMMGSVFLYRRYQNYLKKLYCAGLNNKLIITKVFQTITMPLYACRVLFFLIGVIMLIIMGEYIITSISLIEFIILTVIAEIQKILIARGS